MTYFIVLVYKGDNLCDFLAPSMNFSLLINMKMPTIVGIFIFISKKFFMLSYV